MPTTAKRKAKLRNKEERKPNEIIRFVLLDKEKKISIKKIRHEIRRQQNNKDQKMKEQKISFSFSIYIFFLIRLFVKTK